MKTYIGWLCVELAKYFNLQEYNVMLIEGMQESTAGGFNAASVETDLKYLRLYIYYDSGKLSMLWKSGDYRQLLECFVHEFCHTFAEGLLNITNKYISQHDSDNYSLQIEQMTQKITYVLMKGLPKSLKHNPNVKRKGLADKKAVGGGKQTKRGKRNP